MVEKKNLLKGQEKFPKETGKFPPGDRKIPMRNFDAQSASGADSGFDAQPKSLLSDSDKKSRLLELIKKEALFKGKFVLASGRESDYYIDLRLITLTPEGIYLIAEILFNLLKDDDIDFLGGPTLGADPICGAFSAISYLRGKPTPSFIVRKEEKKHGKAKEIEGPLKRGARVAIVDDVATTGGALIKALIAVKDADCEVVRIISIVDRGEGAKERLAKEGYELLPIFNKHDLGI